MNVLILTPVIPFPLSEGGKVSQFAIIDKLRTKVNLTVVMCIEKNVDLLHINSLQELLPDVSFPIIDLRPPPPNTIRKSGGSSLRSIARKLRRIIQQLSEFRTKYPIEEKQPGDLENPYLLNIVKPKTKLFIDQLLKIVENQNFDLVQFEFLEFADLCHVFPKSLKKVLVHHEIRFQRLGFNPEIDSKTNFHFNHYITSLIKSQERNILQQFDGVITFSQNDKKILEEILPAAKVFVSPFAVLDSEIVSLNEQISIQKMVFLGGDGHYPNLQAVEWFTENVLDNVTEQTGLKLIVYGMWNETNINRLKEKSPNITFPGFLQNLSEGLKHSIMVSPIHSGSGIRTKILYAMAQCVPVVSTTLGCEGIPVIHDESVMIANTPLEYINSINFLYSDPEKCFHQAKAAHAIILSNYTQEAAIQQRLASFNAL